MVNKQNDRFSHYITLIILFGESLTSNLGHDNDNPDRNPSWFFFSIPPGGFRCLTLKQLLRVKEQRNILHEIRKRKANWIGHILRRNCLLQRVTERKIRGGIEVTGRQGRRRSKLRDDLKESRGYSHLKEEALDCTMWRARFGRGFGPVVRQTTK